MGYLRIQGELAKIGIAVSATAIRAQRRPIRKSQLGVLIVAPYTGQRRRRIPPASFGDGSAASGRPSRHSIADEGGKTRAALAGVGKKGGLPTEELAHVTPAIHKEASVCNDVHG